MTPRLLAALPMAACAASVAALVCLVVSRRVRPADAGLWHGIWTSLAVASMAAPLAALATPLWQVAILLGPVDPTRVNAGEWVDRLAVAADVFAAIAVAGSLVFLWRLAGGSRQAMRIAREALPVDPDERARIDRVLAGVSALCRTHERVRVPVAIGWRRPVIVLPVASRSWPDDRLRAILLHESGHVQRDDFFWNVVAAAQTAMFWWNPVAWMVARRVRLTGELASDREAAGEGAAAYASHLIETARSLSHCASPAEILAPGATSDLEQRVDALLSGEHQTPVSGRTARTMMVLVAALVVLMPMLVEARVARHTPPAGGHAARHAERHQH